MNSPLLADRLELAWLGLIEYLRFGLCHGGDQPGGEGGHQVGGGGGQDILPDPQLCEEESSW